MGLGIISPNYRPKYMCELLKPYLPYCTQNFNVEKALRRRQGEYNSSDYSSNSPAKKIIQVSIQKRMSLLCKQHSDVYMHAKN